jgi:CheY-like chemotaxis protein
MKLKALTESQAVPEKQPTAPKRNVLYVEDEDVNWFVAAPNLRDKYALCRARNAAEALAAIHAAQFDLILMDIQLASSGLDGINLTRVLRGTYPGFVSEIGKQQPEWTKDVPIIFVTAYTARYSREELIAAGGSELIGKPVNFVALALTISRLISARIMRSK